jgi:FHS family L-fucose permease-like MFS transporter
MSTNNRFAFIMVTTLFFMWGFVHNLDPVLIPHLKKSFSLTTLQAALVDSSVFIAYFIMAIPAGLFMKRFGYKSGILFGLLLFATGSYLFIPAANTQQYPFFLIALFIIACGLTFLETAANPYASLLGDPKTSVQRLNFAQSFNGLAATVAPYIGIKMILTEGYSPEQLNGMTESAKQIALASEASSVKLPYFIIGSIIVIIMIIFWFLKLPQISEDKNENKISVNSILNSLKKKSISSAVIAQFFYVGAQVCVLSFFILYAPVAAGIDTNETGYYQGGCGLAFMTGRFAGTFLMTYIKPAKLLIVYSFVSILLCVVAIAGSGIITVYSVIGIAFFMSIMFPTIFSLGIKDAGKDTEIASSLIIMAIAGGAILPLGFGYITDVTKNIQLGYFVPMICFAVVLWFGWHNIKENRIEEGKLS